MQGSSTRSEFQRTERRRLNRAMKRLRSSTKPIVPLFPRAPRTSDQIIKLCRSANSLTSSIKLQRTLISVPIRVEQERISSQIRLLIQGASQQFHRPANMQPHAKKEAYENHRLTEKRYTLIRSMRKGAILRRARIASLQDQ